MRPLRIANFQWFQAEGNERQKNPASSHSLALFTFIHCLISTQLILIPTLEITIFIHNQATLWPPRDYLSSRSWSEYNICNINPKQNTFTVPYIFWTLQAINSIYSTQHLTASNLKSITFTWYMGIITLHRQDPPFTHPPNIPSPRAEHITLFFFVSTNN